MARPKQLSLLKPIRMAGFQFLACALVVFIRVVIVYGTAFWNNPHAISFLKDWLPAVVGVMVGVVPGTDWEKRVRTRWRIIIMILGVGYSYILWHSEALTDRENQNQITQAVNSAVTTANQHADGKFGTAQTQVAGVDAKVEGLAEKVSGLDTKLNTKLDTTTSTITATLNQGLQKTESDLDTSIGKVSTSPVQEKAHLQLTLWDDAATATKPVLFKIIQVDEKGNVPIDFAFLNDSEIAIEGGDLWVDICTTCSFAEEPAGFQKIVGSLDTIRHQIIMLNPGVSSQKIRIIVTPPPSGNFLFGIRYACKVCGRISPEQTATIAPSFQGKTPNLKVRPQPLVPAEVKPTKTP